MTPLAASAKPSADLGSPARTVAIAGRPNTGKTTLFNALTGLTQRIANFAGCTVEKAVGSLESPGAAATVVDLPGTYSLLPVSQDERVALGFLSECAERGEDLVTLCVAEASNLANDLALALALRGCGYRVGLVVNMIDEARLNGIALDREALEACLGVPVFAASARSGEGLAEIRAFLSGPWPGSGAEPQAVDLRRASRESLRESHARALREAQACAARGLRLPAEQTLPTLARSIRLDRWLFHPLAGPLALAAVLFSLFQSLFTLAVPLQDAVEAAISWVGSGLRPLLASEVLAGLVCDGALAGIAAVAAFLPQIAILFLLIGFLEQSGYLPRAAAMVDRALRPFGLDGRVFIPFLSSFACAIPGIMATRTIPDEKRRLVALLLSPLMTCSARLPVYALVIAAFVPARASVAGLGLQGLVMAAMYLLGVCLALALALVLRATALGRVQAPPASVLPPYRLPQPKELLRYVWIRCWHFLSRAGRVIFVLSLALWVLSSFPKSPAATASLRAELARLHAGETAEASAASLTSSERRAREIKARIAALEIEGSLLGRLGRVVEPVFKPIGFDWKLSVAVLSSLAAREVFVGTLGTLFALSGESESQGLVAALRSAKAEDGSPRYTLATAVSLLLFFAVALQCVSTIAVVRRETGGWRWPVAQFAGFFLIAYSLSWAGYRLAQFFI